MSLNSKIRTSFMGLKINAQTFLLIYRTRQSGKKKQKTAVSQAGFHRGIITLRGFCDYN